MEEKTPAGQPIVDREKVSELLHVSRLSLTLSSQTAPFLIRAFVKVGSFHRVSQFQDGPLPITDELQIFTWYVLTWTGSLHVRLVLDRFPKGKMPRSSSS
jgi:histone deacetylase complex subunit SAP18